MERKDPGQPSKSSSRLNKDWGKGTEKGQEANIENLNEDVVDFSMDRTGFYSLEWDGLPERHNGSIQIDPKSVLRKRATFEELVHQYVLILDDEGFCICYPSMVQAESNQVLEDVFIDKGRKARKPSYIIPEASY